MTLCQKCNLVTHKNGSPKTHFYYYNPKCKELTKFLEIKCGKRVTGIKKALVDGQGWNGNIN